MLLLGPVDIGRDPWHFGDFRQTFLPNIGEDQTKSYYLSVKSLILCHMVNPVMFIALRS